MSTLERHLSKFATVEHETKLVSFPLCIQDKCSLCEVVLLYPGIEYRCNCPCHSAGAGGMK